MKIKVKVFSELNHTHGLPAYETLNASGMDVRANERVLLGPKETRAIKTGLFVEIPEGYEIQVRPRSGLSLKTELRVSNAPGTIDADYRGEIGVILQNTSGSNQSVIACGERIAQLVLQKVPSLEWEPVQSKDDLERTVRGEGGYGSTGKQ